MCSGLETSTQNLELVEVELGSSRYKLFILVSSTCNRDKIFVLDMVKFPIFETNPSQKFLVTQNCIKKDLDVNFFNLIKIFRFACQFYGTALAESKFGLKCVYY